MTFDNAANITQLLVECKSKNNDGFVNVHPDYRVLSVDNPTCEEIINMLKKGAMSLLSKQEIDYLFNPDYSVDQDEVFVIRDFNIPKALADSLDSPLNNLKYNIPKSDDFDIRALIVGSKDGQNIVFKCMDQSAHLSNKGKVVVRAFKGENTFVKDDSYGFSVTTSVDCVYCDGALYFSSFQSANKVLDMKPYLIEATDEDINKFSSNGFVSIQDKSAFINNATNLTRRRIALIMKDGIFESAHPIDDIRNAAIASGFHLDLDNENRIIIPQSKVAQKELFSFLTESVYRGPFSGKTYMTNSKQEVRH